MMLMAALGALALARGAAVADVADLLLAYVTLHSSIGIASAWAWGTR